MYHVVQKVNINILIVIFVVIISRVVCLIIMSSDNIYRASCFVIIIIVIFKFLDDYDTNEFIDISSYIQLRQEFSIDSLKNLIFIGCYFRRK